MKSVEKIVNGIKITVDYRTELLGIIMIIGKYHEKYPDLFRDYENKFYTDMISQKFNQYKNEDAVTMFDKFVEKHSFNYDAPFSLFLQLDEDLKINKLDDYTFKDRLQSDSEIYNYIIILQEFAKKINFKDFYENNIQLYNSWIDNISGAFKKYNISNFFYNYYGYLNKKEFVINITAFTTCGAYCCDLEKKIVSCYPVYRKMKKDKLFDSKDNEKLILQNPIHEFSHGYVNPITDKYNILNKKTNLFDDIRDTMKKQAYPYDTQIINEHIIRGIEARYIYLIYKDEKWYKERIQNEKNLGFKYIDVIISSLTEYENNRATYKTLDEYYPKIIENIKKYQ